MKGGCYLNNGEFYSSSEYNPITEYKHFPAEAYIKPREENGCGKEAADSGKEATTLQKKKPKAKNDENAKTLIDKLFGSIKGVATAATVAAASVAVTTTLAFGTPKAELLDLSVGDTYVEYRIDITELDEDADCAIVVSTSNEEDIEQKIDGDGTYENRIEGLKPEWEYTLALVQYDTVLGEILHFETKFQTLKYSEQDPMPPPEIEPEPLPDPIPDPEPLPDPIPDPTPTPDPEPEPEPKPTPSVAITGVSVVGLNEIRIDISYSDLPENRYVELDVLFGDMSENQLILTDEDIDRGYITTTMDTSDSLTVTPTVVDTEGDKETRTECESFAHTFTETLSVEVMIGLYEDIITFSPKGLSAGAEYLFVTSSEYPDQYDMLYLGSVAQVYYQYSGEITYTIGFMTENEEISSELVTVTVDTSVEIEQPQFKFSYVNSGEVGITYNDDGTINVYMNTSFYTEDENVYYKVSLGDLVYKFRDPIARIEGIPDTNYPLQFDVCTVSDGKEYSIYHVTPSGTVNEFYAPYSFEVLDGNTVLLSLYDYGSWDLNGIKLVSSSGEVITLYDNSFVYNGDYGTFEATVEFELPFDTVVMIFSSAPYSYWLYGIDDYIGSESKIFEITVYEP